MNESINREAAQTGSELDDRLCLRPAGRSTGQVWTAREGSAGNAKQIDLHALPTDELCELRIDELRLALVNTAERFSFAREKSSAFDKLRFLAERSTDVT